MSCGTRRLWLRLALATAGALGLSRAGSQAGAQARVIALTARRFRYEPNEIALKAGERVVIEIRALDFIHGMNIPDLGRRFDLLPGVVTQLELQPPQAGVIDFVCDNFCGEGHEDMHGRFVVSA